MSELNPYATHYSEDEIQNSAESIYAIADTVEELIADFFMYIDPDEAPGFSREKVLSLIIAIKQLAKPLI